jgi:hypothetical protein
MFSIAAFIMLSADRATCAARAALTGGSAAARNPARSSRTTGPGIAGRAATSTITSGLSAPNQRHHAERADT